MEANKNVNIIDFVLTYAWFDKIASGEKTHEYRLKETWEAKLNKKIKDFKNYTPLWIRLRRGYSKTFMLFNVLSVCEISGKNTDLKADSIVYDFKLGELLSSNI